MDQVDHGVTKKKKKKKKRKINKQKRKQKNLTITDPKYIVEQRFFFVKQVRNVWIEKQDVR